VTWHLVKVNADSVKEQLEGVGLDKRIASAENLAGVQFPSIVACKFGSFYFHFKSSL
jgi:hypothetical protein